jgi:hypothetical protein
MRGMMELFMQLTRSGNLLYAVDGNTRTTTFALHTSWTVVRSRSGWTEDGNQIIPFVFLPRGISRGDIVILEPSLIEG